MSLNRTILTGRLTQTPETKLTPTGTKLMNFSVAWNENYGNKEKVHFIQCVAFEKNAEFIKKYFQKGDEITIEGRLSTRKWRLKDETEMAVMIVTVETSHFGRQKKQTEEAF